MARTTKRPPKKASRQARRAAARGRTDQTAPASAARPATVTVTAAKGRPMLTWVGKRPLRHLVAFPAQLIETFEPARAPSSKEHWNDWPQAYPSGGLLFHGDNKEVLAHLLGNGFRGKVALIYVDPPFDSGADYVRKVTLRGPKGTAKLDGESYTLGEQLQYTDIWANDNYLQFMYERLLLLRELLAENGSLYLHCDPRRSHQLHQILDEIFGSEAFKSEIVWRRSTAHSDAKYYGAIHDVILFCSKSDDLVFNRVFVPYNEEYIRTHYPYREEGGGRQFGLDNITSPHLRPNLKYEWKGLQPPHFGWRYDKATMERLDREGRIHYPSGGGRPRLKRYRDEMPGIPLQDLWDDVQPLNSQALESVDFPTQKPEELLERILRVSSRPGDLVLDCFIGSGTTAAVAQKLGRRWIACDINKGAVQVTSKRLQMIVNNQFDRSKKPKQAALTGVDVADTAAEPAQLSLAIYRVNDYDLAIQHFEAANLACEHLGVERSRTDQYFDGTLGKRLVKIAPFNHALTLLDLDELKREIEARPGEDRNIVIVCLGKEAAADTWIAEWNRLRSGRNAVNRIEVIELRTDPKYGKFFKHEPARARIKARRDTSTVIVEIQDFISPSIIERLEQQAGLLRPKIDDWRAMVDCLLIDGAYNGKVFNITHSDVPERKSELVVGRYDVPAPPAGNRIAIKIIDMLGEEVLMTITV